MINSVTFNRHDLLFLDGFDLPDHPDRVVIAKWIGAGRPAIVRRLGLAFGGEGVHCGIPLPPEHGKKRIAFIVPVNFIKRREELPSLENACAICHLLSNCKWPDS
ncbi:MAG: hypothetical protein NT118_01070 [Lentisphaerae bacterium]|nr:hypothetical protein [Lentisphaerota bacterium]